MALKKRICIRCLRRHYADWHEVDEDVWLCGYVLCPDNVTKARVFESSEVPDTCPFLTEYTVSQ